MLQILETFNHFPTSYKIDESVNFQPGQMGSLKIKNDEVVVGLCDGINPIGIIDDIKSKYTRKIVWDRQINLDRSVFPSWDENGSGEDVYHFLADRNIINKTFFASINIELVNAEEGRIKIPKGTPLNKAIIDTSLDAISFTVRYAFNMLNSFDDSTQGSKRVTIWNQPMICRTDMFDVNAEYGPYQALYVKNGFFTSRKIVSCPRVGTILELPSFTDGTIKILFDLKNQIPIGM